MSRPEDILPPDLFYNDSEARKYTTSSRIRSIQASMTRRALEFLDLESPSLILDIGCGSGLSGEILAAPPESDSEDSSSEPDSLSDVSLRAPAGTGGPHTWIGMDISSSMLGEALSRDAEGDMFLADMGQGVPFRAGTFDAAISISAIQWLCNAEEGGVEPAARLKRFFDGLYASLRRGARAVCQFYPKNAAQREMISAAAVKAGFGAGILEDDPETKNVKLYLVLTVGGGDVLGAVEGMDGVDVVDARRRERKRGKLAPDRQEGSKAWILRKKAQMEAKGKVVKASSKYTGRKRKIAF